jgi:thioredoxin 1
MAAANIATLTKDNFQTEVLNASLPVLVDFWAEWCGPCKMIAPVIDELATELDGKVKIGKVNVDDHQELAVKYGISSIPTLLIFKGGQVVDQSVGLGGSGKRGLKERLLKAAA